MAGCWESRSARKCLTACLWRRSAGGDWRERFANFGYASIRPFFSRRIGLGGVPVRFGTRVQGELQF
jgi:hypothetical protein